MERICHPVLFGETVASVRKSMGMNQVEFYRFLFQDTTKEEETIKKKMNKIENGKQVYVDFDFFLALCTKCDVSADYLIGKESIKNYDIKAVCEYTGLSEKAVQQLHRWQIDANNGADLSIIGSVVVGEDGEAQMDNAFAKQSALQYLKILNHLFNEGVAKVKILGKTRKERFSNVGVLHSLYLLCMTEPKKIIGKPLLSETFDGFEDYLFKMHPHLKSQLERVVLDASSFMVLQDYDEVWYPLDMKNVIEQFGRKHLNESIDRLIDTIRKDDRE